MSSMKAVQTNNMTFDESKLPSKAIAAKVFHENYLEIIKQDYATEWVSKVGLERK